MLKLVGVEADVAENGRQALELVSAAKYDTYSLILMDLQMPIMDGHEATIALRQDRRIDHVPIVALTAHAISEVYERCMKDGMQDYLTKPIQPHHFFAILNKWLGITALPKLKSMRNRARNCHSNQSSKPLRQKRQ